MTRCSADLGMTRYLVRVWSTQSMRVRYTQFRPEAGVPGVALLKTEGRRSTPPLTTSLTYCRKVVDLREHRARFPGPSLAVVRACLGCRGCPPAVARGSHAVSMEGEICGWSRADRYSAGSHNASKRL